MGLARRMLAAVFAGDRRVWRAAAVAALPLLALTLYMSARPRFYYTGTNSAEDVAYVAAAHAHEQLCLRGLELPAQSEFVRLRLMTAGPQRPPLSMVLRVGGASIASSLQASPSPPGRVSNADFRIPRTPAHPAARAASACITAAGRVEWAGTPLTKPPEDAPLLAGRELKAQIAVWYLPRAGARSGYLQRAGSIFSRAALFRPGLVGAWTYPLLLFVILPALALLAVRCLALAAAGHARRLGAWLFAIAAANACCWALLTPVFQGPDEVDHFAYVQSVVERGEGPSHDSGSPLQRWSGEENRALEDMGFFSDHQVGDTKLPWLASQQRHYETELTRHAISRADGGGYTTSAAHGPVYYLALAPAYLASSGGSVFAQLTLMRFASALIGALVVLFAFMLARELAPGRLWLAVLAALLVAFQPMYGFISGIVNNDVGINAAAAALELLLIRMLRRGPSVRWGLITGAVLLAMPAIKGTGLSLYPVAALLFVAGLWRHHSRADLYGWGALVIGALVMGELTAHVLSLLQPAASATGSGAITSNANAVSEALHHIPTFLSYLWQALLPRLPFMSPHFPHAAHAGFALFNDPGFVVYVERAWAAFGWYDVFFPKWVYVVIFGAMVAAVALGAWAARREWTWVRRHGLEVLALILMPCTVIVGVTAAYYQPTPHVVIPEFGRYAFPAIAPIALLVVGALHAFPRRRMLTAGVVLLVAMIGLSYASQLLTLASFYA